jgi:predicted amidohydrolase
MARIGFLAVFAVSASACAGFAPGGKAAAPSPVAFFAVDRSTTPTIRVAAVQMRAELTGGLAANERKAERLVREAAAQGARYILFPEVCALFPSAGNSYRVEDFAPEAQPVPGPLTDHMVALARELKVCIAIGMAEKQGATLYNAQVFVDPTGVVGVYHKRCLITHASLKAFAERRTGRPAEPPKGPVALDEATLFAPGKGDGKTGVLICADGGFDGFWAYLAANGAQLLCYPVNNSGGPLLSPPWPDDIARKYARPVIFANHIPVAALHVGNSQIIDARGEIVARAESAPDKVIVADVEIPPLK